MMSCPGKDVISALLSGGPDALAPLVALGTLTGYFTLCMSTLFLYGCIGTSEVSQHALSDSGSIDWCMWIPLCIGEGPRIWQV